MLLQEDKGEDGVWSYADEARYKALEHPAQTLCPRCVGNDFHDAFVFGGAHYFGLDHVDRGTYCGGNEACHETCGKMCGEVVFQWCLLEEHALEDVVRGQLPDGHEHGAR